MRTFEITIQRRWQGSWPVVCLFTEGDELPVRCDHELNLHEDYGTSLRKHTSDARAYGEFLGKALFRDKTLVAFEKARSHGDLHVLLFVEDDELKSLHWERLCAPIDDSWDFLALDQRVPFSLYLPSNTDRRFPVIAARDLRALVVVASPKGLGEFELDDFEVAEAVSKVSESLAAAQIPYDVLADLDRAMGPPTLNMICTRLTEEHYTLLHIVCHGRYAANSKSTALFLANPDDPESVLEVGEQQLLENLRRLRSNGSLPHFAFLASCESAHPSAEAAFGGLGRRFVRDLGMPAVLAMTQKISVDAALKLSRSFYGRLAKHGEPDRALVEACASLTDQREATVPALFSRLGGRTLFSTLSVDATLMPDKIDDALTTLEQLLRERAPVLRPKLDELGSSLRGGPHGPEPDANTRRRALDELNRLSEEVVEISFDALALKARAPAYDHRCPFLGLAAFGTKDEVFFFGRKTLIETLRKRLASHNFLAVVGPSGSGKSSLVLAGLVPRLIGETPGLRICVFAPGEHPLEQLQAEVPSELGPNVLVIVDQFEEVFTACHDEDQRRTFFSRLAELASVTRVVITMRADFWGSCAPYPVLKQLMREQELIAAMDDAELRRAVELQASEVRLRFEADLINTMLDDVRGEPGAMPLLQHALFELWERRHGRWLSREEHRELGGVQKAIAYTAEQVYRGLDKDSQDLVREIFLRLTRVDVDAVGPEGRRDTRRRVMLASLTPAGRDAAMTKELINRLANARLVVTGWDAAREGETVEIAHEALIRHWPQFAEWLDEDRPLLRVREEVRRAASAWQDNQRDASYLVHRGKRVGELDNLVEHPRFPLNDDELAYVVECRALGRREQYDIAEMGWGVIFAAAKRDDEDTPTIEIKQALRELLVHRRRQAGSRYREFCGLQGYRPNETAESFLLRHGVGSGPIDPQKVPYYLLIVGDPETIPFSFQYQLDVRYAVGRIDFDALEDYARYARSVVLSETCGFGLPRRAVLFGVLIDNDGASEVAARHLVNPLADTLPARAPAWNISQIPGEETTKARLATLLGGDDTPALLFTLGPALTFPGDTPDRRRLEGAIVCRDWPGPRKWRPASSSEAPALPEAFCFSGDGILADSRVFGLCAFFFGSSTAGAPKAEISNSFVSHLPKRLLAHPLGGALAVIGHVGDAHAYSFFEGTARNEIFVEMLTQLMDGKTVGVTMEPFNRRFAELATSFTTEFAGWWGEETNPAAKPSRDKQRFAEFEVQGNDEESEALERIKRHLMASVDLRNYVILGDPAVRLRTSASSPATSRPQIKPVPAMHDLVMFNGIDAATGGYHTPPMPSESLAKVSRGISIDEPHQP